MKRRRKEGWKMGGGEKDRFNDKEERKKGEKRKGEFLLGKFVEVKE